MKRDLDSIKRSLICPLLSLHKWNYNESLSSPIYLYGIKEMFRWYARRGGMISIEALLSSISSYSIQKRIDSNQKIQAESLFRKYLTNSVYFNIKQPLLNYDIQLNMGGDILTYSIPVVSTLDGRICLLFYDLGKMSKLELISRLEVQVSILYFFLIKNETPIVYNVYVKDDQITEDRVICTIDYLNFITQNIRKVMETKPSQALPSIEVCYNCFRRNECHQTRSWLKKS